MDMQFYWVQDRIRQGHYNVFWKPGSTNSADYFTKYHPHHHYCHMCPVYLHYPWNSNNESSRVCYSSQKTSQNKYQSKTQIRKKSHLQIIKIETHI